MTVSHWEVATKRRMGAALHKSGIEHPLKKITLDPALTGFKQLEDFVTNSMLRFFTITGISADFLKRDVDSRKTDDDYKSAKTR